MTTARSKAQAQALYMRWLKAQHPRLFAATTDAATLSGFSETFDKIVKGGTKLLQTYVTSKKQLDTLKTNTNRAKQGLPPITDEGEYYDGPTKPFASITPVGWALFAMGGLGLYFLLKD